MKIGITIRLFGVIVLALVSALAAVGQQSEPADQPVIVRPGAPGQPSTVLPSTTRGTLPPISPKDIEFMQGMIMHHAQAVEMTAMIASRTKNTDIHLLGERISKSQIDEMELMKRWLALQGHPAAPMAAGGHSHHGHGASHNMMPGMLTAKQMDELRKANGTEFDRLFLAGMIQHHEGALVMVKDLFDTAGAGQDAALFSFASDIDAGQRVEITTMKTLLEKIRK
jgi:uncharacterized protein (DUF305 family)